MDIDVSNPASFNVEMSFEVPDVIQEDTIRDNQTLSDLPDDTQQPVTFTLIDSGTKRGKNKLADSLGYTYRVTINKKNRGFNFDLFKYRYVCQLIIYTHTSCGE